jgi:hypothetical protein
VTTRRDPLSLLPFSLVPLLVAAALLVLPGEARPQDEAIDLFDPSISACSSAPDAAWYYQINGGSDERCQIEDIRAPMPSVAFKTLDAPSGTDPVADAKDDTLTLTCSGGITCTGDSATDALALSSSGLAPFAQYDPMKPPSSPHACTDEFVDGFQETWTGQNVGTSTFTAVLDGAQLEDATAASANDRAVYWNQCTEPSGNFTVIVRASVYVTGTSDLGIAALESGTEASPTKVILCSVLDASSIIRMRFSTITSYTGTASAVSGTQLILGGASPGIVDTWIKFEYDDTADKARCYGSRDGVLWVQSQNDYTLTTDPVSIGLFGNSFTVYSGHAKFFRVREDANRAQASD